MNLKALWLAYLNKVSVFGRKIGVLGSVLHNNAEISAVVGSFLISAFCILNYE